MYKLFLATLVGLLLLAPVSYAQEESGDPHHPDSEAEEESAVPQGPAGMPMMAMPEGGMPMMMDRDDMQNIMGGKYMMGNGNWFWMNNDGLHGNTWAWIFVKKLCILIFSGLFFFVGAFAVRFGWEMGGKKGRK